MTAIICSQCGDEMPGATNAEALEDARNTGWREDRFTGLTCAECVLEEEQL